MAFRSEDAASALLPPTRVTLGQSRQRLGVDGRLIRGITTLIASGAGRVDWGHATDQIAHGRFGVDGFEDLWLMDPDGGNAVNLTSGAAGVPQEHNGQPCWHPDGDWIVFQSKDPALVWPGQPEQEAYATQTGAGFHNNLWAYRLSTGLFYQLTTITAAQACLHPHFSHDGQYLVYSKASPAPGLGWTIRVDEFTPGPPPTLVNAAIYQPGAQPNDGTFFETHGFSLADDAIFYSTSLGHASTADMDISRMHFPSGASIHKLTDNSGVWDEHAILAPLGLTLSWVTSYDYDVDMTSTATWQATLHTDLGLMDTNGYNQRRLTYYNELGYLESTGKRTIVADHSWNGDGDAIVASVNVGGVVRLDRIDLTGTY
jgi:hypothetical protein